MPLPEVLTPRGARLLEGDGCASGLEGSLCLLGSFLRNAFEDGLRRAIDNGLGLAEAQAGELAHNLDDLDLLVANGVEDDVERALLFDLFGSGGGASGSDRKSTRLNSSHWE